MIRIAAVLLALLPANTFAWGKQGRHLVVGIARGLLDQKTIDVVDHYLGTTSWSDASDWLEITTTPRNAEPRKQWQRVLIPRDKTYVPTKSANLVNQIEYQLMVLEKLSIFPAKDLSEALKTLFALVACAHQPLHCGYTEDQGGASVTVSYHGKTGPLLKLWDDDLLILRKCDMWDCSKHVLAIPPRERAQIESAKITEWVAESRAMLKDVYAFKNGVADSDYLDRSREIAESQIVKAGLRLAAILNRCFNR